MAHATRPFSRSLEERARPFDAEPAAKRSSAWRDGRAEDAVTNELQEAKTPAHIRQIWNRNREALTSEQVLTALIKIEASQEFRQDETMRTIEEIHSFSIRILSSFQPQKLPLLAMIMSKLGVANGHFFRELERELSDFRFKKLGCCRGDKLALLSHVLSPRGRATSSLFSEITRLMLASDERELKKCSLKDLSCLADAFADRDREAVAIMPAILSRLHKEGEPLIRTSTTMDLAILASSFAKTGKGTAELYELITREFLRENAAKLRTCSLRHLDSYFHALGLQPTTPLEVLADLEHALLQDEARILKSLKPASLVKLSYAFAQNRAGTHVLFQQIIALLTPEINSLSDENLILLFYAYSLRRDTPLAFLRLLGLALQNKQLRDHLSQFDGDALVILLRGFSCLTAEEDSCWQKILQVLLKSNFLLLGSCSAKRLALLCKLLCEKGQVTPATPAILGAIANCFEKERSFVQLSPSELTDILQAFAAARLDAPDLYTAIHDEFMHDGALKLRSGHSSELATVAASFATLRFGSRNFFQALLHVLTTEMQEGFLKFQMLREEETIKVLFSLICRNETDNPRLATLLAHLAQLLYQCYERLPNYRLDDKAASELLYVELALRSESPHNHQNLHSIILDQLARVHHHFRTRQPELTPAQSQILRTVEEMNIPVELYRSNDALFFPFYFPEHGLFVDVYEEDDFLFKSNLLTGTNELRNRLIHKLHIRHFPLLHKQWRELRSAKEERDFSRHMLSS